MTTSTTTIPLNRLAAWEGNVRKTGASDGIDELAASIAAHGLLQSLVVRKAKRGKFTVVAGRRRLLAMQRLAKERTISADYAVPCVTVGADLDATELSLAENVVRMPMHPADQFEAFRHVIEGGATLADVAARFGVSETLVARRLKLGRLSPVILDAYRQGDMGLELVQAFTVSDDHSAQERVWRDLPDWNRHPGVVKGALTEGEMPATDKRVRLIGLEAYEAAGGAIRRDLFDPDNGGTILDTELLEWLVVAKLEAVAAGVRAEGWKWVEIVPDLDYDYLAAFHRRHPETLELSEGDQAELDSLLAQYDDLTDSDDDDDHSALQRIEQRIDQLNAATECWATETLTISGAIVSIGHRGDLRIVRGLVWPEDDAGQQECPDAEADDDADGADQPAIKLSAKLVKDLTAQKSAAISAELARQPDMALAAVAHALALRVFYDCAPAETCLQITAIETALDRAIARPESCSGLSALQAERRRLVDRLPGELADLWPWCLRQTREVLLDLLAVTAAHLVNAIEAPGDRLNGAAGHHAHGLAQALSLDMTRYFTSTAESFFSHVTGAGIQAAMREANIPPSTRWAKLKKVELAALAERELAGTGWLPEPLRMRAGVDTSATTAG